MAMIPPIEATMNSARRCTGDLVRGDRICGDRPAEATEVV
jgi:hypothetical protein